MHRVAFPYSLNIGTDIVFLPRVRRLISQREGRSLIPFAKRILHPLELRDLSRRYPRWELRQEAADVGIDPLVNWLAGRFAAKEAARKAMGATTLGWKDVRVDVEEGSGRPRIICAIQNNKNLDVEHEAKLSISHDGDYVVATVLATGLPETVSQRHLEDTIGS